MLLFTSLEASSSAPAPPLPTTNDLIVLVVHSPPGSTGNEDITDVAFNGDTPVAALFVAASWRSPNVVRYGYGATDGTNQWASGSSMEAGGGGLSNINWFASELRDDLCIYLPYLDDGGFSNERLKGSFVSFIPNGIRINWTDISLPAGSFRQVAILLFGGVNCKSQAGVVSGPSTGGTSVSTSFKPDMVFAATNNSVLNTYTHLLASMSFGISDGVAQRGYASANTSNFVNKHTSSLFSGGPVAKDDPTAGTSDNLLYQVSIDTFTGSSFKMTASSSTGSDAVGYFALSYSGIAHHQIGEWDLPSDFSQLVPFVLSGLPFKPDFGWIIGQQVYDGDPISPPGAWGVYESFNTAIFDASSIMSVVTIAGDGSANNGVGFTGSTTAWDWTEISWFPDTFTDFTADGWSFDTSSGGGFNQQLNYLAIHLARTYAP